MTGIIPDRIGLLASLQTLNLANNQFSGKSYSQLKLLCQHSRLLFGITASKHAWCLINRLHFIGDATS